MTAMVRASALLIGLCCYGLSMAMMVRAGLGLDPWDVFHQGLSLHTPMTIGMASAAVGVVVLLAWIPLRNRPGIGTVANVIVIAVTVDAGLAILSAPQSLPARVGLMVAAVVLNAVATVLYVGAGLGPGPRDGLMTGLVVRRGFRFGWCAPGSKPPYCAWAGCWAAASASARSCTRSASAHWLRWCCGWFRRACSRSAAGRRCTRPSAAPEPAGYRLSGWDPPMPAQRPIGGRAPRDDQ